MIRLFSKYVFLLIIRLDFRKNRYENFKDLNFKHHNIINYKTIKHYSLKENFIFNEKISDIHAFNFLYLFLKIGGEKGIKLSKKNIFVWFKKFKFYNNFLWSEDLPSKRLINILYNYDFICSLSDEKEIRQINHIINFHIKRINFDFKTKKIENISSFEILSIFLIESIKRNFNKNIFLKLREVLNFQVDENSMHKSYNILEHAKFLNNLNEIKNILLFFNFKIPDYLNDQILSMTSLLKTYQHIDSSLPLFNGCNNNHNIEVQNIYAKEQFLKTKPFLEFKSGIAVYKDLEKAVFFDVVQPTSFAFHKKLSAGSLSIEISAEGEKIITNCGGSEGSGKNPSYLKYSAAHSTIIINNTNISEIKEGDIKKIFPKQVIFESKDDKEQIKFTGSHNGYLKNYRKICKREIEIDKKKSIFHGQDTIISTKSDNKKTVYHIRFHMMPETSTILTGNKKNIIIRTKKNNMWMFKSSNEITIEKSIYVKDDLAIETSQIVISGVTSLLKNRIKWSLEKI
tara:strand:- start:11760 stop:13298 length:1539 start_codon:yes stop_codon:yes gene_type:complete